MSYGWKFDVYSENLFYYWSFPDSIVKVDMYVCMHVSICYKIRNKNKVREQIFYKKDKRRDGSFLEGTDSGTEGYEENPSRSCQWSREVTKPLS